ncbi:NAD-dependent epimerase/dehydratase-like protein [Nemania abortiva]|nr:NAD-dependent epimerase/dehydratase-like protein [Nemania abortiva]
MHLLILGDSGRTGKQFDVALMRSPSSSAPRPVLTPIPETPMQREGMAREFGASPTPPEAVLVALSLRRVSDSPFAAISPDTPDGFVANAIFVMKYFVTKRIIILNQWGAGSSLAVCANMRYGLPATDAVDEETRQTGVEFVVEPACVLAGGDPAPVQLYPENGEEIRSLLKATRASVARFMVEAYEKGGFADKSPGISN